jgi:putative membrane protein
MNHASAHAACAVGALACLFAAGCSTTPEGGFSLNDGATTVMGAPGLSAADRHFALVAANSGHYDVMASQLASAEAADPRLRDLAQSVAQDRQEANQELMTILEGRGILPRQGLPPDKQAAMNSLAARESTDFDNQYLRTLGLQDKLSDMRLLQEASNSITDPALRTWAVKTLPMLRAHQAAAEELAPMLIGWNPIN